MKPSTVFFSAILPAIANGAALSKRQSVAICYGDKGPNLNDCDSLVALLGWTGTSTGKIEPDPSGGLTFYHNHHALNCEIGIAWNDPNNRLSITISSLLPYINIIKDKCVVRSEAGGESNSVDDNWTTYSLEILSRAIERPGFRQKVGPQLSPTLPETSLTSSATEVTVSTTETSPAVETSVTETFISTIVGTTSNDLASTTLAASSADTTTLFTTETSAETTGVATTIALSETTTTEMSTTTTEATEPTGFFIIAGEGPALGQKLQSSEDYGSIVSFSPTRGSRFDARRFTIDDITGVLTNEGTPMCASFNAWDKNRAKVTPCIYENRAGGGSYITCDKSPSSGDILHCTAVKLNCRQTGPGSSQACEEVEDPLWNNQFFIQRNTGANFDEESILLFGQDNLAEAFTSEFSTIEKVDLFVSVAMVSAPPA